MVEQLDVLPEFVAACGFANAKAAGYEADDFLAAAVAARGAARRPALVASGDRDAFQLASERTTILHPIKAGEMARIGPAEVRERYGVEPRRCPISSRCAATRPTGCPARAASGRRAPPRLLRKYPTLEEAFAAGQLAGQAEQLRLYRRIATMDAAAPLPACPTRRRLGTRPPPSPAMGTRPAGGTAGGTGRRLNPLPHGRGGTGRAAAGG